MLGAALDLVVTGHAFVALDPPVRMIDRMLTHPLRERSLRAFHAVLKGHVGHHPPIGPHLLDATARGGATEMAENCNDCHEHCIASFRFHLAGCVHDCRVLGPSTAGRSYRELTARHPTLVLIVLWS